jgi:PIN domain nuclease of toxin-antitoxin system
MSKQYVFDETALYAMFNKERGGEEVQILFNEILDKKAKGFICSISIGELYALNLKKKSFETANKMVKGLLMLPVMIQEPSLSITLLASDLKVKNNLTFPESYSAALALELKATLITRHRIFETVEDILIKVV